MTMMSRTQMAGPRRMRLKSMVLRAEAPSSRSSNTAATGRSHAEHGPIHVPRPYTGRLDVTGAALCQGCNGRAGRGVPRAPWRGSASSRIRGRSGVDVRRQGPHEGQVPVALGVVEAVADDELRVDVEAHVLDVDVDLGGRGLAQQRADLYRGRAARAEVGDEPGQGQPGVDDVLDDQHVATGDVAVQVLQDPHDAGGL